MARVLRGVIVLAVLWCLIWAGVAMLLRQTYHGWFDARADMGWNIDYADFSVTGFPLRHRVEMDAPMFVDPFNGTAWSARWLTMESPAIWPGHFKVAVAPGEQRLSFFDQTAILTTRDLVADLRLAPRRDLELQSASVTSGAWRLRGASGHATEAEGLAFSMIQSDGDPALYDITFEAPGFSPSSALQELSARAQSLPPGFDSLTLRAAVTFERPWGIGALENRRPQPRLINLELAEAQWGDLLLRVAGEFTVDKDGIPDGQISIQAKNWAEAVEMGREANLAPPEILDAVEQGLSLLATMTGGPDSLDVRINLRGGMMSVGLIPIGPAPRIILR